MFAVTCGFVLKTKCKIDARFCCAPPGFFGGGHKNRDAAFWRRDFWKGLRHTHVLISIKNMNELSRGCAGIRSETSRIAIVYTGH